MWKEEKKMSETLPKMLPGVVCAQMVRCGKPNCKCARGELHGPYHFRFWRDDGRLRKQYVKAADLAAVQAACELRRKEQKAMRASQRRNVGDLHSLLAQIKQYEESIIGLMKGKNL
jgi:hypothetical protein